VSQAKFVAGAKSNAGRIRLPSDAKTSRPAC